MDLWRVVNGERRRIWSSLTSLSVEPMTAIDSAEDTADTFYSNSASVSVWRSAIEFAALT